MKADIDDAISQARQKAQILPSELDEMINGLVHSPETVPLRKILTGMAIVGVGIDRVIPLAEPLTDDCIQTWAKRMRDEGVGPIAADNGSRCADYAGIVRSFIRQQAIRELYETP